MLCLHGDLEYRPSGLGIDLARDSVLAYKKREDTRKRKQK